MARIWEDSPDRVWEDSPDRVWENDPPNPQIPELVATTGFEISGVKFDILITIPKFTATAELELSGIPTLVPIPEFSATTGIELAAVNVFSTYNSAILYFLTITGAADSLPDIEIPMSSFQSRRRSGEQTSLTVVIPTIDYAAAIQARPNGTMKIDQGYEKDGEIILRETIIETDISQADPYEGSVSQSQVLTGYSTTTYTPKAVELTKASTRAVLDGKVQYRIVEPYVFLNPGDTVTIGSDTFISDVMSYSISVEQQILDIGEA